MVETESAELLALRRRWYRWTALWIAVNVLMWSLAHALSSCGAVRGVTGFTAILLDAFVYLAVLCVLPWSAQPRFSVLVATTYSVLVVLILWAYISMWSAGCVIID